MHMFLPQWLVSKINVTPEDVCYAMKLSGITNRRTAAPAGGKLAGFMSGLGNVIGDAISSAAGNSYLLKLNNGVFCVVSDKTAPMQLSQQDIRGEIKFEPGAVHFTATFTQGEIESAGIKISSDKMNDNFCGNLRQLIIDFDFKPLFSYDNLLNKFVTVNFSTQENSESLYKFRSKNKTATLISFDENAVYLHNERRKIDFEDVLTYNSAKGYYAFLVRENAGFELIEIFEDTPSEIRELELNLVRDVAETSAGELQINVPENPVKAESFVSAFELNGLSIVAIDDSLYSLKGQELSKCGLFKSDDNIYVSTENGITEKYAYSERITKTLSLLPIGCDSIFLEKNTPQSFVVNGEIKKFVAEESVLKADSAVYEYDKMLEYSYLADDFSCKINFTYNNTPIEMTTANSLGLYISKQQEKVYVGTSIKEYSINKLYDSYYKNFTKNFLATTFAEIYKTEKLLNNDISVEEIINAMRAEDSEFLRGAFKSFLGKFKNVEDLQSDLVQKIALLEIQRKKIQKMYDEWTLYYPHYMATMQVCWLKNIFGSNVNGEMLNSEYWKCVAQMKRILTSCNSYVQKSMNEIASCTGKLSSALPAEVRRADITQNLRITSHSKETMLKAGSDIVAGVAAGMEVANILIRGFSATSPLSISMSAKMLVDSYVKDVEMRKDIKAFGMQSLEWWTIFMKGIRVHIMEITNSVNEYNKLCLKRDTDLFKKLPEDKQKNIMAKLSQELRNKIIGGIDDKFVEIMPQFNLRISNIIDEIDGNSELCNMTLEEFKGNLFV